MHFNEHLNLKDKHAFLSASKSSWINYDEDKLTRSVFTAERAKKGVELHELASNLIRMGIKLPRTQATLNSYVNDAISYRMSPEQVLYYSENCFGTADAICFRKNFLRIHDLKTGITPASEDQLYIYSAYFCLEYKVDPMSIQTELRIYQNDDVLIIDADPTKIAWIMDKTKTFDKKIREIRLEIMS